MKRMSARQAWNKAVNLLEFKLDKTELKSMPQVVDIVLTKACNLACTFCKDYEAPGARKLAIENFEKVGHQLFPTARWLSFCSGGEPYLHKGLEDMLRLARKHHLTTWVLSNGMLLEEERMRTIVREGLVTLQGFSVDGMEAETVEAIRVNAKMDTILENIAMLVRIREQERKHDPEIVIRYAIMRKNIEELPAAVDYWATHGIQRLNCNYLSLCNGIERDESLYFHKDLTKQVFVEARKAAAHYPNFELNLPPEVDADREHMDNPMKCQAPWNFIYIDTAGDVMPCYHSWGAKTMGNVYGDDGIPVKEVWNSKPYQELRRTVNDDSVEKAYTYCGTCEARYGWGGEQSHLGDEAFLELADMNEEQKADMLAARLRPGLRAKAKREAQKT